MIDVKELKLMTKINQLLKLVSPSYIIDTNTGIVIYENVPIKFKGKQVGFISDKEYLQKLFPDRYVRILTDQYYQCIAKRKKTVLGYDKYHLITTDGELKIAEPVLDIEQLFQEATEVISTINGIELISISSDQYNQIDSSILREKINQAYLRITKYTFPGISSKRNLYVYSTEPDEFHMSDLYCVVKEDEIMNISKYTLLNIY